MAPVELKAAGDVESLINDVDTFIFDCDGVLWLFGGDAIPGAVEVMRALRLADKKVLFVTNNASKSRRQLMEKFLALGIEAKPSEVYGSAYAAAAYLSSRPGGFSKKVFVVGMEGVEEELDNVGIEWIGGVKHKPLGTYAADTSVELDQSVGAVVAGFDYNFTWTKCAHACFYLNELGAEFVATNQDASGPIANGRRSPGGGTVVAAIEKGSGKAPVVVGKPSQFLMDHIVEEHGVDRSRAVMVGDSFATDMEFGRAGGLKTLLVMSGVADRAGLQAAVEAGKAPTYVAESLGALAVGLKGAEGPGCTIS